MNSQPLGGHVQDLQKLDPGKSQHGGGEVGISATEELMTFDSSSKTEHLSIIGHLVCRLHSRSNWPIQKLDSMDLRQKTRNWVRRQGESVRNCGRNMNKIHYRKFLSYQNKKKGKKIDG